MHRACICPGAPPSPGNHRIDPGRLGTPLSAGLRAGQLLTGLDRPEERRRAFEWALAHCDRQLHRAVLRRLASDIDQAYLLVARRAIQDNWPRAGSLPCTPQQT